MNMLREIMRWGEEAPTLAGLHEDEAPVACMPDKRVRLDVAMRCKPLAVSTEEKIGSLSRSRPLLLCIAQVEPPPSRRGTACSMRGRLSAFRDAYLDADAADTTDRERRNPDMLDGTCWTLLDASRAVVQVLLGIYS